jgi:hypothetical protein
VTARLRDGGAELEGPGLQADGPGAIRVWDLYADGKRLAFPRRCRIAYPSRPAVAWRSSRS